MPNRLPLARLSLCVVHQGLKRSVGFAKIVKQRTNSSSPIEFVPYDQAYEPGFEDMMRRVPSIEKLYALTGFRPQTPLLEIIDRVASYFRQKEGLLVDAATVSAKRSVA